MAKEILQKQNDRRLTLKGSERKKQWKEHKYKYM